MAADSIPACNAQVTSPAGRVHISRPAVAGLSDQAEEAIRPVLFRLARDLGYSGHEVREVLDASVQALDAIFSGRRDAAGDLVATLKESREAEQVTIGDLEASLAEILWRGKPLPLRMTRQQRRVLMILLRAQGRVVLYGSFEAEDISPRSLHVQVVHIRRALAGTSVRVETVWGSGLRLTMSPAREAA